MREHQQAAGVFVLANEDADGAEELYHLCCITGGQEGAQHPRVVEAEVEFFPVFRLYHQELAEMPIHLLERSRCKHRHSPRLPPAMLEVPGCEGRARRQLEQVRRCPAVLLLVPFVERLVLGAQHQCLVLALACGGGVEEEEVEGRGDFIHKPDIIYHIAITC